METVIIMRYGEIFLKGDNKWYFEKILIQNIKSALKQKNYKLEKIAGRYILSNYQPGTEKELVSIISKIFGLHSASVAVKLETDEMKIKDYCSTIKIGEKSFKVITNRADKTFPIKSMPFSSILGAIILENNPKATVNVKNPDLEIMVDIREDGNTYVSTETIECAGGMPVSSAGKGLLLLSGGIDSPVAGWFMSHRGMHVNALHFHSFPYTSLLAKEKVIRLAQQMSVYGGDFKLHIISFTKAQEEINKKCNKNFMVILMRRLMMRIAEKLAHKIDAKAIITGESLGQVASQTIESINATNAVVDIPVFRPLIGFDKNDTINISKKIGTYDISIEPYEDCCTVFLPKNPVTRPKMKYVLDEESKLDIEKLVNEALETDEVIDIIKKE